MRTITKAALAMILLACAVHGQTRHELTVKVTSGAGQALPGARVTIKFLKAGGESVNRGLTDEKGEFHANTELSLGTFLQAEKTGHYTARLDNTGNFEIPQGKFTVPLVLPRILRPIPLHVRRVDYLQLPAKDQWLEYDLNIADWMPPYGIGKTADIRFRYSSEFIGWKLNEKRMASAREANPDQTEDEIRFFYGKWRGELEVSFQNPKEGMAEETERYWYYNQLRLPHAAPEDGYKPSLRFEANTYEPRQPEKLVGYYMRTRVRLDEKGEIESANYAKIYGDIKFDARGTISFWYYYNPTPNDRNLEFDPARNLFPRSMSGTNVANP